MTRILASLRSYLLVSFVFMKNKAEKLLDKNYVSDLIKKEILPMYPDFSDIKDLKIITHKDYIWEGNTYHVVIEYRTKFITKSGKFKTLPIFCSAHSDEPRKNVYDALKFLWENGFGKGYLTIPHALYYSEYFKGTFYRGVAGRNLYRFIRDKNFSAIEEIIPKAAQWFAKLHNLDFEKARNFNKENSRIETVFPGIPHILLRIKQKYPEYAKCYMIIYDIVNSKEKEFLKSTDKRWLVHGDAHPENVIKMGQQKIAVIDFTDLCLSDFTRDVGSFIQQLEYMTNRKIGDKGYTKKIVELFKDNYFSASQEKFTPEAEARMMNYYYWTTMRTASHFLMKDEPEPERAKPLIKRVCEELGVKL